jgi:hypothetical protein
MKDSLDEVAEKYVENFAMSIKSARQIGFKDGAKWQQERSYSEEEMRECYEFAIENVQLGRNGYEWVTFEEWFEQFKKK